MSSFPNAWLAGIEAGQGTVTRAYSIADALEQLGLAKRRMALSEEDQGFQREQMGWHRDDRARMLAERAGAQQYFAGQAGRLGMFDLPETTAGAASLAMPEDSPVYGGPGGMTSDFAAHDDFAQMPPDMAQHQVDEAYRRQIQMELRRQQIAREEVAFRHLGKKFGPEVEAKARAERALTGDLSSQSFQQLTHGDPLGDALRMEPEVQSAMGEFVRYPADGAQGPPEPSPQDSPLARMSGRDLSSWLGVQRAQRGAAAKELTDEEADSQARSVMQQHPQMSYTRAVAFVHNRHDKLVNELDSTVTGEGKRGPITQQAEYIALGDEIAVAKSDVEEFEHTHRGMMNALKPEEEKEYAGLRDAHKRLVKMRASFARQYGAGSTSSLDGASSTSRGGSVDAAKQAIAKAIEDLKAEGKPVTEAAVKARVTGSSDGRGAAGPDALKRRVSEQMPSVFDGVTDMTSGFRGGYDDER